jgi:diadenosine tetraphosphate (Ap4A) HIT family hydrolase
MQLNLATFRSMPHGNMAIIHRDNATTMSSTPSKPSCYFCKVTSGQADPFIFENRSFVGIFDTNPVNPGHALIIPRRHFVSIFDLNEAEQSDYFDALLGVKSVIETTDFAELYPSMMAREDLSDRPMDHIQTVLGLPFLGNKPDAYTVGNNDGRAAGRSIDHLHVILLPRYKGDVEDPRGGIRNVIAGRAHYQRR